ncbi:MAG TPA: hypothetical protein VFE55_03945 [Acidimicrobiia bacterium]|nr:hypothetical protein [Acidimicrobiia bacterium]
MTMDTNPDHSEHLDDETLSALLDGDAAGASADAHLAACERCSARRGELAAARSALAAAPVEPLDELARRRLVAAALRAAGTAGADGAGADGAGADGTAPAGRSRWAPRHRAVIGSAAAVLLLVLVGVPFVVGRHGSAKQADTSLSAEAPLAAPAGPAAGPFLGDLGDLTDHDRLRLSLSGVSADSASGTGAVAGAARSAAPVGAPPAAPAPAAAGAAGSTAGGTAKSVPAAPGTPPSNSSEAFASNPATDRDRADAGACVAALLDGPARGGRLTGSGVGTWRGRPAVVAAFELSGGTVAFVADRSGCDVLDRFAL